MAGNGGSAADSEHITGELMKRFKTPRPIDPALAERLVSIDPVRGGGVKPQSGAKSDGDQSKQYECRGGCKGAG